MSPASTPEIAVVIPSYRRPVRLRWLLNALAEQTLAAGRWELVVCDDSDDPEIDALLAEHPLARAGTLRALSPPARGRGTPARQRNAGRRAARAPLVAFTDNDCRPAGDWLERLLDAAARTPGAVLQGRTVPDRYEAHLLSAATHARSQSIDPPTLYAQTCNVAYPRELLEGLGGFDEELRQPGGEDTDLGLRARAAGAAWVAVPESVVEHAVETMLLRGAVANAWRWRDLPGVVARHPEVRRELVGGVFWRASHAWLPLALAGGVLSARRARSGRRRRRWRRAPLALLALPWAVTAAPARGPSVRGRLRAVSELPGRAVVDAVEVAGLAWGSVRHRALLL